MVNQRREKRRSKRSQAVNALVEKMSQRVETETLKMDSNLHCVVGKVDGKVLYTSKPLRTYEHGARLKKSWQKRISKKLAAGRNYD